MNAKEARQLATTVSTKEQEAEIEKAISKIRYEAEHGNFSVRLWPHLIEFVEAQLLERSYDVQRGNSGDQRDGPYLEVSW